MTTNAIMPPVDYIEDGSTLTHPIPFKFLANSDLVVSRIAAGVKTVLGYGADYSVAGAGDPAGGTLTKVSAGTAGVVLQIARATARIQGASYEANDTFPAAEHEAALDRSMLCIQDADAAIADTATRSQLVPPGETAPPVPALADRAGGFRAWDADGNEAVASGTGNDAALRTDLAANGSPLVKVGAVGQSLEKMAQALPAQIVRPASAAIDKAWGLTDSFSVEPYPYGAHGVLFAAFAELAITDYHLTSVSGRASVQAQTDLYGLYPVAADRANFWMFGQNDAHHFGAAAEYEFNLRLLDFSTICLAELAWLAQADDDAAKQRGSDAIPSMGSAWVPDTDFAEGGAIVSDQAGDVAEWFAPDCQYLIVTMRKEHGSAGRGKLTLQGIEHLGPDGQGFRTAPFSNFAHDQLDGLGSAISIYRGALFFNLGRRHKKLKIQAEVLEAGAKFGIHSIQGFSAQPFDGPWLFVGDLSDRNEDAGGFDPAAPNQAIAKTALPALSRTIMQCAGLLAACGARVVDLPMAATIDQDTMLEPAGLHPDDAGVTAAAAMIAGRVRAAVAGHGLFSTQLALAVAGLLEHADGYPFMAGLPSIRGTDGRFKRDRLDGRGLWFGAPFNYLLAPGGIKVLFDAGTGTIDTANGGVLEEDADHHFYVGATNGAGELRLLGYNAVRFRLTNDALFPEIANSMTIGKLGCAISFVNANTGYYVNDLKVIGDRRAALPADATDLASVITLANAMKAGVKTTGGHGLFAD